jgi:alkyldihydroxyacetonephosphate synthase
MGNGSGVGCRPVARQLKHWGWGYEDEQPPPAEQQATAEFLAGHLGFGSTDLESPAPLPALPAPRLRTPAAIAEICSNDVRDRALHALGRSYRDTVRAFRGCFEHPPDVVARPRDESEVQAVLEWAVGAGAAVIPFGGGTSVVGGVEPRVGDGYAGVVTIDLTALDRVLEVDASSCAARIQAGALGPGLEQQLAEYGLTLRHYPQSFAFSTLGGWIATRAGGHFATRLTHIDDLVESVRALTPAGLWASRRLPASGAGVSPDRMLIGSEGTLGVITEAWVRVRPRPQFRASAAISYPDFTTGADAVRALSQSDLYPSNCRLLDPLEAGLTAAGDGTAALLLLAFEAAGHDVEPWMSLALKICTDHGGSLVRRGRGGRGGGVPLGGVPLGGVPLGGRGKAVDGWRDAFLRAPYLRDTFVAMGVISETFETAITWDRFPAFHAAVVGETAAAVRELCGAGTVSCRFTHVYPDGPAPYYTVLAPARRGEELEQWAGIKRAASDALLTAGGTITHHHAVGRDHRPWYDRQRPDPFALALQGAKAAVDPTGALNPGVLIDPVPGRGERSLEPSQ